MDLRITGPGTDAAIGGLDDLQRILIYRNEIFDPSGWSRIGIDVGESATATVAHNNRVSFPETGDTINPAALTDASADLTESHNFLDESPGFCDPGNADPLLRDFTLQTGSAFIDAGTPVPVFEDFQGQSCPNGPFDTGAFEWQ